MLKDVDLQINGKRQRIKVDPERSLLSVLRDDLDLTGTKYGCGEAQCGACTVLVDGKAVTSCVLPVSRAVGKQITTIEGLEKNGTLHPLQEAFLKADAMQCAYCTSGMIMAGVALLAEKPRPTRQQIIEQMNRNICRCGTYERIIAAIQMAAGGAQK
ncbi:MAG TPA: (2Fe-2S)-binding protein [Acidobacteriota bacterium]|jgi:aerobic-type carbon monoxide dehydrogenase small subunit (CoxS/CutS family)|nr:(2Fe-2S)-binding protein [Acidobacteriota bacterium]